MEATELAALCVVKGGVVARVRTPRSGVALSCFGCISTASRGLMVLTEVVVQESGEDSLSRSLSVVTAAIAPLSGGISS